MEVTIMVFSEIYSAYYNAVAYLIEKAMSGELNEKNINDLIGNTAFSESFLYISNALKNEDWCVINKEYKTPMKHIPKMPLSELELSFLKSIISDKRFLLFADIPQGLEAIEPLYVQEDFYIFDNFKDGDNYEDETYKENFKIVLQALKENRKLHIEFTGGKGGFHRGEYIPRKLEFSAKDDRFRLICKGNYSVNTINLARISKCSLLDHFNEEKIKPLHRMKAQVEIEIKDKRNALERMMTTFANYQKETRKINDNTYILKLNYYKEDETELLIRILSFGPMVKVLAPQVFIEQIKERINKQMKLRN